MSSALVRRGMKPARITPDRTIHCAARDGRPCRRELRAIWLCAAVGPALTSCRSTLETQKVKSMTLKRIALFFRMVVRRSGHACAKVPPHALHVWLTASKRCLDRAPPPVPPHRHPCPCPSAPATCRRRASPRLCLPLCTLRRPYRRSAPAVRRRSSSRSRGALNCRCRYARSGDPTAVRLRRCGADHRPGFAARRSAAAAACAPAAPPLSRSGSTRRPSSRCHGLSIYRCRCTRSGGPTAVPLQQYAQTVILVPRLVDLLLLLRALRRPYCRSAPAARRQPSSKCRSASICHCRCTRSNNPVAVLLRRLGADRCPGTTARQSSAAAARAPATPPPFCSGSAVPTVLPAPRRVDLPLPLRALRRSYRRSAPAARCRPSSLSRGALICHCRCVRSGDPVAFPLRRHGANHRPMPQRVILPHQLEQQWRERWQREWQRRVRWQCERQQRESQHQREQQLAASTTRRATAKGRPLLATGGGGTTASAVLASAVPAADGAGPATAASAALAAARIMARAAAFAGTRGRRIAA